MKKVKSLIPIAAFALAIAFALITNIRQAQAASGIYGFSSAMARCLSATETLEPNCSTTNSGAQCTVQFPSGEFGTAYATQANPLICSLVLKQPGY